MGLRQRTLEDMVMFGDVYEGRRVFVTGHTGFKGAWLTQWLLDLGALEAWRDACTAPRPA